MRLVQQQHKEERVSLPAWLSRDVPHERELARELLDQMGREKSLDYLLHLHDKQETRRQKRLKRYYATVFSCGLLMLLSSVLLLSVILAAPNGNHLPWFRVCVPLTWVCTITMHVLNFQVWGGRRKKTPMFSSEVQQKVITCLLDYAESPLIADALSRATGYYMGDRKRLYERLAHVLSLLPDNPDALTKTARDVLWRRMSPAFNVRYAGEAERIPALRSAIARYFARTGEAALRSKRGWFKPWRD